MWIWLNIEPSQAISERLFNSFDEAFDACSNTIERDFQGNYIYDKDKIRKLFEKFKFVTYNFGWYFPSQHYIKNLSDNYERIYPHTFSLKDYNE